MRKIVGSRWYIVDGGWVKNVNNLGNNSSISCGRSSTETQTSLYIHITKWVQTRSIELNLPHYSTTLYTHLKNKFNLLNKSFTYYPQHLLINPLFINTNLIRCTAERE